MTVHKVANKDGLQFISYPVYRKYQPYHYQSQHDYQSHGASFYMMRLLFLSAFHAIIFIEKQSFSKTEEEIIMDLTEAAKKVLLAGVGAAALTVEKSSEIVDTLVKKGELTVEQGKALNQELKHDAEAKKAGDSEPKEEKKDVTDILNGLSDEDLAKLKEALAEKEKKDEA